jgi:hypothetical protein
MPISEKKKRLRELARELADNHALGEALASILDEIAREKGYGPGGITWGPSGGPEKKETDGNI